MRVVDPTRFVERLNLPQQYQQDVQEFNSLFLSLLQTTMAQGAEEKDRKERKKIKGDGPLPCNLIHGMFQGELTYTTTCEGCRVQSPRKAEFLDVCVQVCVHPSLFSFIIIYQHSSLAKSYRFHHACFVVFVDSGQEERAGVPARAVQAGVHGRGQPVPVHHLQGQAERHPRDQHHPSATRAASPPDAV
jgi:hypothetical protein